MTGLRYFMDELRTAGELLEIHRTVEPRFELGALLQQAETRGKAILFHSVAGSDYPVVGGLLASPARFGLALGKPDWPGFTASDHSAALTAALAKPLPCALVESPACREVVTAEVDLASLPVPTFFAGDSGPFLTAAVGIARNPANGVLNAGFYRVLVIDRNTLGVSISPGSDLFKFVRQAGEQGELVPVALAIGVEPALLMAAAAKVAPDVSELDVAGALQGESLQVIASDDSELLLPANAEFILELELNPADTLPNTMGEFGDVYGTQGAFRARVTSVSHRREPVFHSIMAGAGTEHNTLGKIILYGVEPIIRQELSGRYPGFVDARLIFDPPFLSSRGDLYLQFSGDREIPAGELVDTVFALVCGSYPLTRLVRRIVLVDADIDLDSARARSWSIAARATSSDDYVFCSAPDEPVRFGIDARAREGAGLERLSIPGFEGVDLDDYL